MEIEVFVPGFRLSAYMLTGKSTFAFKQETFIMCVIIKSVAEYEGSESKGHDHRAAPFSSIPNEKIEHKCMKRGVESFNSLLDHLGERKTLI